MTGSGTFLPSVVRSPDGGSCLQATFRNLHLRYHLHIVLFELHKIPIWP